MNNRFKILQAKVKLQRNTSTGKRYDKDYVLKLKGLASHLNYDCWLLQMKLLKQDNRVKALFDGHELRELLKLQSWGNEQGL